ncbi:MAG: hypothetical protein K6G33_05345 [Ruminococcus sp.]|uniref:hypothetical protein n=1 Tax=Ruminococcus sp. TaxID=41978 RepID=UPI0025F64A43|nr:hypothetical protein [Ruminococcus sp.]MCR5600149.1 hypothetical protein [Ruminococcus sp.]
MIIDLVDRVDKDERIGNCRVQSLCDLLKIKGMKVSPHALFLTCFNSLIGFSEMNLSHMKLPMLSGFCDNFEEAFFKEENIEHSIRKDLKTQSQLKETLINEGAFIILCDSNSILHQKMNKATFQVGVCSGITLIGYKLNNFIFSQLSREKSFSKISAKVLEHSRTFKVYPSAPESISIHISDNAHFDDLAEKMNTPEYLKAMVERVISERTDDIGGDENSYLTNQQIKVYCGCDGYDHLMQFFESLYDIINDKSVDNDAIKVKIVGLKLRMLRKSLLSGSATFNRSEFADSIYYLSEKCSSDKLRCLADGFKESGDKFRNIARFLYQTESGLCKDANEYVTDVIKMFKNVFNYENEIIQTYFG